MAIGTVTIGETPCCGVIERTYECWPDEVSPTGMTHQWDLEQSPYAPNFAATARRLDRGICPDCGTPLPGPAPELAAPRLTPLQTRAFEAWLKTCPACGCPECDAGVRPGHFACAQSEDFALDLERKGILTRHYDGTSWVWEVAAR
jgi:hypothetical protein